LEGRLEVDVRRWAGRVVLGFLAFAMVACASLDPRPAEEIVTARAQQRWDALVRGDISAAYEFFSPGSRAVTTVGDYAASIRSGFWKVAQVTKVECTNPESCDVHLAIEYDFRGSRIRTPLKETWIKEGSSWWYVRK
jgi:hypothetical protein